MASDVHRLTLPYKKVENQSLLKYSLKFELEGVHKFKSFKSLNLELIGLQNVKIDIEPKRLKATTNQIYLHIESLLHPEQPFIRDFAYEVSDPRHFGHMYIENLISRARVVSAYKPEADDQLSVSADEIVLIFKNMGDGWLSVRKMYSDEKGIIPENCVNFEE